MAQPRRLKGGHALSIFVSTELKTRLTEIARSFDRPMADVVRTLLWVGLPILEGMDEARREAELTIRPKSNGSLRPGSRKRLTDDY